MIIFLSFSNKAHHVACNNCGECAMFLNLLLSNHYTPQPGGPSAGLLLIQFPHSLCPHRRAIAALGIWYHTGCWVSGTLNWFSPQIYQGHSGLNSAFSCAIPNLISSAHLLYMICVADNEQCQPWYWLSGFFGVMWSSHQFSSQK